MSKNDQNNFEQAQQHAAEAAKRLFGNRTTEVEEALKKVTTIGHPKNLIEPEADSFDNAHLKPEKK